MITHDPLSGSSDPSRLSRLGPGGSTGLWEALRTSGAGPFRQLLPVSAGHESESSWGVLEVDVVQADLLACKIAAWRVRFSNRHPFDRTKVERSIASVNSVLHDLTLIEWDTTHERFLARTRPARLWDPSTTVAYFELLGSSAELSLHRYLRPPRRGPSTLRTARSLAPFTWTEEMFTDFVDRMAEDLSSGA